MMAAITWFPIAGSPARRWGEREDEDRMPYATWARQGPSFHLSFYTAPLDADPWSVKTWRKANPALGDFRSLEDVKRLAVRAQRIPAAEASFRNLILNQRVDQTQQFLSAVAWKACGELR